MIGIVNVPRLCGHIFCGRCSAKFVSTPTHGVVRSCDECFNGVHSGRYDINEMRVLDDPKSKGASSGAAERDWDRKASVRMSTANTAAALPPYSPVSAGKTEDPPVRASWREVAKDIVKDI